MTEQLDDIRRKIDEIPDALNSLTQLLSASLKNMEKYFALVDDKLSYLKTDFKALEDHLKQEDQKASDRIEGLVKRMDDELTRLRNYFDLDHLKKAVGSIVDLKERITYDFDPKEVENAFKTVMERVKKL